MTSVFITGTDTNVGKTTISAAVLLHLRSKGFTVGYEKPAETGCKLVGKTPVCADVEFVTSVTGCEKILPTYALPTPVAPAVAARLHGVSIDPQILQEKIFKRLAAGEKLAVEGAGGLLVPLSDDVLYADFIAALDLPTLVVASAGLGTINHTLLTLAVAKQYGIKVVGVVLNCGKAASQELAHPNLLELQRLSSVPFLGVFPHVPNRNAETISQASKDIKWDQTGIAGW